MGERGRPRHDGPLTESEARVVKLVAKGLTNREVGETLGITERTVKFHLNQVYSKLAIDSREELISWQRQQKRPASGGLSWLLGPAGAIAAASLAVVAVGFGAMLVGSVRPDWPGGPSLPCSLESVLIEPGMQLECLSPSDVETAFGSSIYRGPPGAEVIQSALVRYGGQQYAFTRYALVSGHLDVLQGDYAVPWQSTPHRPFVAGDSPLGIFGTISGEDVLYLCPEYSAARPIPIPADRCPEGTTLVLAGRHEAVLGSAAVSMFWPPVGVPTTPVPFPTPLGERVQPAFDGVPTYPNAVEIDGFMLPKTHLQAEIRVQVYETGDSASQVLDYFVDELTALCWQRTGGNSGISGRQESFFSAEAGLVTVSTIYVAREEDRDVQPPPGFRGPFVPYEDRVEGRLRFWVMTSDRAPSGSFWPGCGTAPR